MTTNKEDYLKAIYSLGGLNLRVSNKKITEKLGVSLASVSEMMVKLSKDNLVDYKAYCGSLLTQEGLNACIKIVRSHRLWEVFLMRHLGYTWREAHEEAHLLEHISAKRLVDRLDVFLNYPQSCPHGAHIPREGQENDQNDLIVLSELNIGDCAIISRVVEEGSLLDYISKSGLEINKDIKLISKEEYEGPISFIQNDITISISYKAATQIYVKLI